MNSQTPESQNDGADELTQLVPASAESATPPEKSALTSTRTAGMLIGEFRLLRLLGRGGMAEVWLADQTSLKRNVALKLLHPDLMADATYVKRFRAEAKAAAGLNHPNLVQVFTVGMEGGQHFIAQEYVQGQTLKALIKKKGPLEVNLALHIIRQVAAALEVAGSNGIVHRDIKPENIMLTAKGQAKVADFGLAQLQGGERLNLTQEGVTMGTPLYMSPEQVSGRKIDPRSDIYSFGVTCYHMLSGRLPFQGENAVSVAVQHLNESPRPLGEIRKDLPKPLCDIVHRMMAKRPKDRYATAGELLTDLRKLTRALKTGDASDLSVGPETASSAAPLRNAKVVVPAVCLVLALLASGIGWTLRPGIPQPDPNAIDASVRRMGSARAQYEQAMFQVDNEDAFRAVKLWFPDDRLWVHRAEEQLALLYLHDRRRWDEAERQLQLLQGLSTEDERFHAEGRIGQAALQLYRGNEDAARRILQASAKEFEDHLSGSWARLEEEVRQRLEQMQQGRETAATDTGV